MKCLFNSSVLEYEKFTIIIFIITWQNCHPYLSTKRVCYSNYSIFLFLILHVSMYVFSFPLGISQAPYSFACFKIVIHHKTGLTAQVFLATFWINLWAKMGFCPFHPKNVAKYPYFETRFSKNRVLHCNSIFRKSSYRQSNL